MKKIAIIAMSSLATACSSGDYVTDVSSESHQEEYEVVVVEPAIENTMVGEVDVTIPPNETQQVMINPKATQNASLDNKVVIAPPTQKQQHEYQRFGYTIQVVSVGSSEKASGYAQQLPSGHPVWEHYKQVEGTEWYAVLYGDYATKSEAKAAMATLPDSFQKLKPFVKSLDKIENSPYPKLRKLK